MKIINKSKLKTIATKVIVCDTYWSSRRGLMFRKKLQNSECLLIDFKKEVNAKIHMFFVRFPIDVVWLNSEKTAVSVAKNVTPNSVASPSAPARYVLELPVGTIKQKQVSLGDKFSF